MGWIEEEDRHEKDPCGAIIGFFPRGEFKKLERRINKRLTTYGRERID